MPPSPGHAAIRLRRRSLAGSASAWRAAASVSAASSLSGADSRGAQQASSSWRSFMQVILTDVDAWGNISTAIDTMADVGREVSPHDRPVPPDCCPPGCC